MASNNALTLKGSNPNAYGGVNYTNPNIGVKSLYGSSGTADYAQPQNNKTALQLGQSGGATQPKTSGMIQPSPSTPLKKVTTNNVDGSSVTHEYYDNKTGLLTPEGKAAGKPEVNAPKTTSTSTPTQQPQTPTYPGLITNLANQQSSPYNQTVQKSTGMLQDISGQNPGTSGQAYNDYQNAIKELNDLQASLSEQKAGIKNRPQSMESITGELQVNQERNAALLNAAQQKVNQAASAIGYQIQGLGQQQSGLVNAGNLANTGQGNVQGALVNAAQGAKPELGAIGQVPFNPLTQGQGNILGSQGGGLGGAANLLGQFEGAKNTASSQYQQTEQYKSAHQQAQNLQSQLTDLISTFGLNPADLNIANAGIQKIAQNTSDARYKILENYLADVASRYAQILTPAGGAATDTTRAVATSMLDSIASGKSIIDVMNALDQQAAAVVSGVNTNNTGQAPSNNTGAITWDNIAD